MAQMFCRRCGTTFAVGMPYCPQCTSTDAVEDDGMAKISRHRGASDASAPAVEAPADGTEGEIEGDGTGVALPPAERPAAGDRKAEWVAYATTLGLVEQAADALNKGELIALLEQVEAGTLVVSGDGTVVEPADES